MTSHATLPTARTGQLVVTEAGDELMVYDPDTFALHYLQPHAARVWRACDGNRTIPELASECGMTIDDVNATLLALANASLLDAPSLPAIPSRRSRRTLMKGAAIGVAVVSVTAPTAAAQQSVTCVPFNECAPPVWGRECCSGGSICAQDLIDGSYACFPPQFCADPVFWQVVHAGQPNP